MRRYVTIQKTVRLLKSSENHATLDEANPGPYVLLWQVLLLDGKQSALSGKVVEKG